MSWMVRLSLVPDIRHGMSWGTLPYIKLLRAEFGFSLVEAKEIVDRCVFHGATSEISVPDRDTATRLERRLHETSNLPDMAEAHIEVVCLDPAT